MPMIDDNANTVVAATPFRDAAREAADVGRKLRQARELRGVSLEELCLRTKIPVPRLQQIEQGNFGALPPGIYARGMLRAVAREVGWDPERLAASLRQDVGGERATGIVAQAATTHASTRTDSVARVHVAAIDAMDVRRRRVQWCALVGLLLISGAIYTLTAHGVRESAVSRRMAENVVGVSPAAPRAAAATNASGPVMPSRTATAPLETDGQADDIRVDIAADNVCWVSGTADGRRMIYRLLNARDHAEIRAAADLVLRVGDPSALRLTINGGAGRLLGRAGEPVTAHLTRENYRDFLQPGTGPVTVSATPLPR